MSEKALQLNKPNQVLIIENSFKPEKYTDFTDIYLNNDFATFEVLKTIGMGHYKKMFLEFLAYNLYIIKWNEKEPYDLSKAHEILKANNIKITSASRNGGSSYFVEGFIDKCL